MKSYLILDTETTGIDSWAEPVSIAVIDQDGHTLMNTYLTPERNTTWPEAQRIHGISPEFIFSGSFPRLSDEIGALTKFLMGYENLVIYNAGYDSKFIASAIQRARPKVYCAMLNYARYFGDWNDYRGSYRWQKLDVAASHVGHEWKGKAHDALEDCRATHSVWKYLLAEPGFEIEIFSQG